LPGFEASSEPVAVAVDGCGDTARAAEAFFECFGLAREGLAATVGVAAGAEGDAAGAPVGAAAGGGVGVGVGV